MRTIHVIAASIALTFASLPMVSPAFASVREEIATAAQHAGLAAASQSLKETHTHLHHTINCLVGPDGKSFDAKEMNPCKTLGTGAIPGTTDAAKKSALEAAAAKAEAGVAETDLAKSQKAAQEVETMLKAIK